MDRSQRAIHILSFYCFIIALFLLGTVLGNKTVTVISESVPVERKNHIIIDAGHGGEDGGASSCSGRPESQYNLEIALRLDDLLHLLGYDTIMVRKTDTAVYTKGDTISQKKVSDLKERVHLVNSTPNAILVSIHQNNFPDGRYSGAQVFYAKSPGSEVLAKKMQDMLVASLNPASNRKIKQGSGIYLLEKIQSPGILVECGFLSNRQEEKLLSTPKYQKKICCVIASVLACFLESA